MTLQFLILTANGIKIDFAGWVPINLQFGTPEAGHNRIFQVPILVSTTAAQDRPILLGLNVIREVGYIMGKASCINMLQTAFLIISSPEPKAHGPASVVVHNAQRSSSPKPLCQSKPNFMWSLLG